jgi:uncharacterized protein (DUF2252 family)
MQNVRPRRPTARPLPHPSVAERVERGRAARARVPRSAHAAWEPPPDRPDPVSILEAQATTRVPELVPIRYGRMLLSPFAFYRGAAAIMASDLSGTPVSGIQAQLCGDAHLSNFGGFAAPDRSLIFDLNDFDETLPGPWEWDVKRLAASLAVGGRALGLTESERLTLVGRSAAAYRMAMAGFAGMGNLAVWYSRLDFEGILARWSAEAGHRTVASALRAAAKARTKDSLRAEARLTGMVEGELRILADPPIVVPVEDVVQSVAREEIEGVIRGILRSYRRTLPRERRRLLEQYRYVHMARKVVGVGSVGTRAWIVLLTGRDDADPLVLQFKEAEASVLEPHLRPSEAPQHGQRVVEGQRLMQAAGDPFLGWHRVQEGIDGTSHDYYVRQLWDWKLSPAVEAMRPRGLMVYAEMCGWTLARAHARSGDRIAIAAYLGAGDRFDRALQAFAEAYADQNERDHRALAEAVLRGRIRAVEGV